MRLVRMDNRLVKKDSHKKGGTLTMPSNGAGLCNEEDLCLER